MFPATKSMLKEKSSKLPLKLSTASGSGYNPLSGTFHSLEIAQPLAVPRGGGRQQTTAVAADDGSSDSNESCSGESLDEPSKDRQPVTDIEKREKIRQKNERKHQRQRQRRADELLARCTAFLMSRKLNLLADQLVAMGFPAEQATRALIATKGHLEEAVAWLLEPREEEVATAAGSGRIDDGPRINIDEELETMSKMEAELKCSKQELHKAIVACEGDLKQAAEALKSQKPEPSPPAVASPSQGLIRPPPASSQGSIGRPQSKPVVVVPSQNQQPQQRRQDLVSGTKIVPSPKIASPLPKRPPAAAQPLQLGIKAQSVGAAATNSVEAKLSLPATQPTPFPAYGGALTMAALKAPGQNLHRQIAPPSPQPLTTPSSLGRSPAVAAPAPVKWSGGGSSLFACDYNYVDWSLDSASTTWRPSPGTAATVEGLQWPPPPMGASTAAAEQRGGFPVDLGEGLREWTNAFAGRDLFSQSRKVVMSSP